jgi:hypothetical protein
VDAAALPRGVHDLGDRRLDAQMRVGDHGLDAAGTSIAPDFSMFLSFMLYLRLIRKYR